MIIGTYKGKHVEIKAGFGQNMNTFFTGKPGMGKSTAALHRVIEECKLGKTVLVLDWRGTFDLNLMTEEDKKYYEANHFDVDASLGIEIPLFTKFHDEGEGQLIERITEILTEAGSLSPTQKGMMSEIVETVLENNEYSENGIAAVYEVLEAQKSARAKNIIGKLNGLFLNNTFIDGDIFSYGSGVIHLNLNNLECGNQKQAVIFLLQYIKRLMLHGRFKEQPLAIFIDEAQNLDLSETSMISEFLNESRKHNVVLLLAAPMVKTQGKKACMSAALCGYRFFFQPGIEEQKNLAKAISNDEKDMAKLLYQLKKLEKGQSICVGDFTVDGKKSKKSYLVLESVC